MVTHSEAVSNKSVLEGDAFPPETRPGAGGKGPLCSYLHPDLKLLLLPQCQIYSGFVSLWCKMWTKWCEVEMEPIA